MLAYLPIALHISRSGYSRLMFHLDIRETRAGSPSYTTVYTPGRSVHQKEPDLHLDPLPSIPCYIFLTFIMVSLLFIFLMLLSIFLSAFHQNLYFIYFYLKHEYIYLIAQYQHSTIELSVRKRPLYDSIPNLFYSMSPVFHIFIVFHIISRLSWSYYLVLMTFLPAIWSVDSFANHGVRSACLNNPPIRQQLRAGVYGKTGKEQARSRLHRSVASDRPKLLDQEKPALRERRSASGRKGKAFLLDSLLGFFTCFLYLLSLLAFFVFIFWVYFWSFFTFVFYHLFLFVFLCNPYYWILLQQKEPELQYYNE